MTNVKKYTKEEVKGAIQGKFGTVKNYAAIKGISAAAMSERIKKPSSKFVYELKKDGILIEYSFLIEGDSKQKNKDADNIMGGSQTDNLPNDIVYLKELLKAKEQTIEAQKQLIENLKKR